MNKLKVPDLNHKLQVVSIPIATSPYNFTFHPIHYHKHRSAIVRDLDLYYEHVPTQELTKKDIVKGSVYAARYTGLSEKAKELGLYSENISPKELSKDEIVKDFLNRARYTGKNWYRVIVMQDVIGSQVVVRLCDFGDVVRLPVSHFRNLGENFRIMPFLAVKGKLAVVPGHNKCPTEVCIKFKEWVYSHLLFAKITHMGDGDDPLKLVVTMELGDLSPKHVDRVINDILFVENRAVKEN